MPDEPILLEDARKHLRLQFDNDASYDDSQDALIGGLIVAAREWVENFTGLALVEREVTDAFDRFGILELSGWPLASDGTIALTYLDGNGVAQTQSGYRLLNGKRPARLLPTIGESWPSAYYCHASVTATYTAGVWEAGVPQSLKQAMLLLIGGWFSVRETAVVGATILDVPFAVDALARPYRLPVLG